MILLPVISDVRVICKNVPTLQELKDAALEAEEHFSLDELEEHAQKLRENEEVHGSGCQ